MRIDIIAVLLKSFIDKNNIEFYQDDSSTEKYNHLYDEILDSLDINESPDDNELIEIMDFISSHNNGDFIRILFK